MFNDLKFTPYPPGPVPEPEAQQLELVPPAPPPRNRAPVTHILLWYDALRFRWCVVPGDKRGGTRGTPESHLIYGDALAAAGQLAKKYNARALLLFDGDQVIEKPYKLSAKNS